MKTILRKITNFGTVYTDSKSEKRNVILANYTSLVASGALILLIVALCIYYGFNLGVVIRLFVASILFLIPLALNRFGIITVSRLILCGITPLIVFGLSILDLKQGEQMSSSSFVGLRLFLLTGFCFPFLFFNLKDKWLLFLSLSASVLSIIFFDQIFNLFDVKYLENALHDHYYEFNNVRAIISMSAIGLILILLKNIVETNEELNQELLTELEKKNKLIKLQAKTEVFKLNEKLTTNLQLLSVSENRYRSLFEQASDFIALIDFNGNFIDVNESLCVASGYSKAELMKIKIEVLMDPDQLAERPILYSTIQQGTHVLSNRKMFRKDGTAIEIESNVKKLQEDKMLVIARDVTKLREAQHLIELNEAKFRGAFENSAIGMALVSIDTKYQKVNRELCNMVGYTEDLLLSKYVRDITFPEDAAADFELQQQLVRGELETFQREKRFVHRNGEIVWANINISLIKDTDETPLYFVAQIENITQSKRAKEQLAIQQANLKATINNTDVMIWSVDSDFNLLMYNNKFSDHFHKHYNINLKIGSKIFSDKQLPEGKGMIEKWGPRYLNALAGNRIVFEENRFGIDFKFSLSPIIEMDKVIGVSVFGDNITAQIKRDRELAEANKKIGELKLMALRSVMSPHFIFNVLNSIQYFIAKNDRLNAINYLSTFSKLIRSILTHSIKNKIKLSDEIEMLKNYIDLEMTRFENKFSLNLFIDPEIEMESILIPSLLIQPYVENAILHGLYNKQEQGELSLSININDDTLIIEITDDGVGREAAMQLRKYNILSHESMGISITEERLKLINQDMKTCFEIEDLMNEGKPCGTRVRIKISYQYV